MEINLKDVTGWLGIKAEVKTIDEFKEEFGKLGLFTKDQVFKDPALLSEFTGKTLGKITNRSLNVVKANGIELAKEEIEGKDIEDIFSVSLKKQADSFQAKIKELEENSTKGNDEKVKELETKYTTVVGKLKDYESLIKQKEQEFTAKETEFGTKLKGANLNFAKTQLWGSASFAPGTDQLKIKGFRADFDERFVIDLDENNNPFIKNKEGKQIPNPNKHSEFLTPQDVLNMEMEKAGLTSKNTKAGMPAFTHTPAGTPPVTQVNQEGRPLRKLSSRATNF